MLAQPRQPIHRADGVPIFRDFLAYRRAPLQFWLSTGEIAPVCRVHLGPSLEYWVLTEPEFMQHVLQTRVKNYVRERRLMQLNRMGGPELMFNTDKWDEWLWRRRLMQPAFHRNEIAGFCQTVTDQAANLAAQWRDGATVDVVREMKTLTMRVIGKTMFSVDIDTDVAGFQESFEAASQLVFERASSIVPLPLWLPTPNNRIVKHLMSVRTRTLSKIVSERAQNGPQGDLLDMLIGAKLEENGKQFSAEQLVGEMSGIVFAGHETTALTMAWLFYMVSQHPHVERTLRAEIAQVLRGRPPTLADLPNMPYTECVINEVLRLYPPVYVTIREADEADTFADYDIAKGTRFMLNIRGLHRSAQHWQRPAEFDPTRFLPENSQKRHKWAFMPFLGGPKKCLGDVFAMIEMQLIVPTILQRYRLHYTGTTPPKEAPSFVMHPAAEIGMRLEAISQN